VTVDPAAGTVYVANYVGGSVSVIDAATNTVTGTIGVGTFPVAAAVDPATHAVYVANGDANTVSVISAPRPAPAITLTSSRNPATFGHNVTLTATAGPADGGTITFTAGPRTLCPAVPLTLVSGSQYRAACGLSVIHPAMSTRTNASTRCGSAWRSRPRTADQ
jgi:YVTN family beta-propeller protein